MQSRKIICNITVVYVVGNILAQIVINLGVNKLRYLLYRSMRRLTASVPQGLKFKLSCKGQGTRKCHRYIGIVVNKVVLDPKSFKTVKFLFFFLTRIHYE